MGGVHRAPPRHGDDVDCSISTFAQNRAKSDAGRERARALADRRAEHRADHSFDLTPPGSGQVYASADAASPLCRRGRRRCRRGAPRCGSAGRSRSAAAPARAGTRSFAAVARAGSASTEAGRKRSTCASTALPPPPPSQPTAKQAGRGQRANADAASAGAKLLCNCQPIFRCRSRVRCSSPQAPVRSPVAANTPIPTPKAKPAA